MKKELCLITTASMLYLTGCASNSQPMQGHRTPYSELIPIQSAEERRSHELEALKIKSNADNTTVQYNLRQTEYALKDFGDKLGSVPESLLNNTITSYLPRDFKPKVKPLSPKSLLTFGYKF